MIGYVASMFGGYFKPQARQLSIPFHPTGKDPADAVSLKSRRDANLDMSMLKLGMIPMIPMLFDTVCIRLSCWVVMSPSLYDILSRFVRCVKP